MKLLIIYTGGTIGMIEDETTGALKPFNFDHLLDNVPRISKLGYEIDNIQFDPPLDSSDIQPAHWRQMAEHIRDNIQRYDGIVILHGTDTMAYTASALSFMLQGVSKPVIITGSQLPIGEVRTDGEENLITALQIAAARNAQGQPMVQEVAILFENFLWRGNRATKMSADRFNAFISNNYPPLAQIGLFITYNEKYMLRHPQGQTLHSALELDPSVMVVDLFPGLSPKVLRHMLEAPGIKGVVLRTFGAGNAPTSPLFLDEIRRAVKRGLVILNVTQCVNGSVNPGRYVAGDELSRAGVISGRDITCEAALTKMMHLFGQGLSRDEVCQALNTSLCGECTIHG